MPYLHTAGVSELYQSRGYKVCPHVHSHLGWLHLHRQVHYMQISTLSCANCLTPATACSHLATYLHATACVQVHCHKLFENLLSNMDTETPLGPVPKAVPEELREDFLLGGLVNLTLLYFDQRHRGETVPYNWTAAVIGTHCGFVLEKHRCHQCRNALPVRLMAKLLSTSVWSHACRRPVLPPVCTATTVVHTQSLAGCRELHDARGGGGQL